jgi:hypothetical protein
MKSKIIEKKDLSKYNGKFLDVYPLHFEKKDKNGKYTTVLELRGISPTIKENFQSIDEIMDMF